MTMKLTPRDPALVKWDLFGDFAGEAFDCGVMLRPSTREWFTVEVVEPFASGIETYPRGALWIPEFP